jgi:hypothetical protein
MPIRGLLSQIAAGSDSLNVKNEISRTIFKKSKKIRTKKDKDKKKRN